MNNEYVVTLKVCDLRRVPSFERTVGRHDRNLESQLVWGERLRVLDRTEGWCFIEALEQRRYATQWELCKGWVPEVAIVPAEQTDAWNSVVIGKHPDYSIGTRLNYSDVLPPTICPKGALQKRDLFNIGMQFIGCPYLWGGRSTIGSGIDCSGLVNLLYRIMGIDIPRDAHDQYLKGESTSFNELKSGDLIFHSEPAKSSRINHVLLYDGEGGALEATEITDSLRHISLPERYGSELTHFNSGDELGSHALFFAIYT